MQIKMTDVIKHCMQERIGNDRDEGKSACAYAVRGFRGKILIKGAMISRLLGN
jgi:hypothetical protein